MKYRTLLALVLLATLALTACEHARSTAEGLRRANPKILTIWDMSQDESPKTYAFNGIKLTLSYVEDDLGLSQPRMEIGAPGMARLLLNGAARPYPSWAIFGLVELDPGNSLPEVIFETDTGGAHCCEAITLAYADGDQWKTVDFGAWDGDIIEPVDLDHDGVFEFVMRDNRFLYAFAGYAISGTPIRILKLRAGNVIDDTRNPAYAQLHRENMESYREGCMGGYRGFCAAFVAEASLLGEPRAAWNFMLQHYDQASDWPYPRFCRDKSVRDCLDEDAVEFADFPAALAYALTQWGYLPDLSQTAQANPTTAK